MVAITARYDGELHCTTMHGPSGATIATDAPLDNHGKGACFSPTDLVAAAVATCILTVMGIAARKLGIAIEGAEVHAEKTMVATPIRRIGTLVAHVTMPATIPTEHRATLEKAALTCPVKESMHPETAVTIHFHWK